MPVDSAGLQTELKTTGRLALRLNWPRPSLGLTMRNTAGMRTICNVFMKSKPNGNSFVNTGREAMWANVNGDKPRLCPWGRWLSVAFLVGLSATEAISEDVTLEMIRELYLQKFQALHSFRIRTMWDSVDAAGVATSSPARLCEELTDGQRYCQRIFTTDSAGVVWEPVGVWAIDGSIIRSYMPKEDAGGIKVGDAYLYRLQTPLALMGLLQAADPVDANLWKATTADLSVLLGRPQTVLTAGESVVGGVTRRLVEMRGADGRLFVRAWLAPEFGFAAVEVEDSNALDGTVLRTRCRDFVECRDGLFLAREILISQEKPNQAPAAVQYRRSRLVSVELNPALTDSDLTVTFPAGTKVTRAPEVIGRNIRVAILILGGLAALAFVLWTRARNKGV